VNYETSNPLTENESDIVSTGAYSPFGTSTSAGQVIKGAVPCTGAILRIPLEGGKVEMVSWGLRNPFGLYFCQKCHPAGEAGLGPSVNANPAPQFLKRFQVRHGLGVMPAFNEEEISTAGLRDISKFMKAWKKY
jgi:hypothetical protein